MIRKWVKLLPYFIVMWFVKHISASYMTLEGKQCRGWRIDDGEFIVWSEQNFKVLQEKRRKNEVFDKAYQKEQEIKEFRRLKKKFSGVKE